MKIGFSIYGSTYIKRAVSPGSVPTLFSMAAKSRAPKAMSRGPRPVVTNEISVRATCTECRNRLGIAMARCSCPRPLKPFKDERNVAKFGKRPPRQSGRAGLIVSGRGRSADQWVPTISSLPLLQTSDRRVSRRNVNGCCERKEPDGQSVSGVSRRPPGRDPRA
jgi:hypothetical protein